MHSGDIRDRSLKLSEVDLILHIAGPTFFGGRHLKILGPRL